MIFVVDVYPCAMDGTDAHVVNLMQYRLAASSFDEGKVTLSERTAF
jgi:hypothetical protein